MAKSFVDAGWKMVSEYSRIPSDALPLKLWDDCKDLDSMKKKSWDKKCPYCGEGDCKLEAENECGGKNYEMMACNSCLKLFVVLHVSNTYLAHYTTSATATSTGWQPNSMVTTIRW